MNTNLASTDLEKLFQHITEGLPDKLPAELKDFQSHFKLEKSMLCILYPLLPNSQYELRLDGGISREVMTYFKDEKALILGLYFKSSPRDLIHWLKIVLPRLPEFRNRMRKQVMAGPWGKRGAFVGMDLRGWGLDQHPELYANVIARFIETTYVTGVQGLNAVDEAKD